MCCLRKSIRWRDIRFTTLNNMTKTEENRTWIEFEMYAHFFTQHIAQKQSGNILPAPDLSFGCHSMHGSRIRSLLFHSQWHFSTFTLNYVLRLGSVQLTSARKGLSVSHNMKLAQIRFFHSNYNSSLFTFFTILYTKSLLYADYTRMRHHTIQSVLRFNSRIKKI